MSYDKLLNSVALLTLYSNTLTYAVGIQFDNNLISEDFNCCVKSAAAAISERHSSCRPTK